LDISERTYTVVRNHLSHHASKDLDHLFPLLRREGINQTLEFREQRNAAVWLVILDSHSSSLLSQTHTTEKEIRVASTFVKKSVEFVKEREASLHSRRQRLRGYPCRSSSLKRRTGIKKSTSVRKCQFRLTFLDGTPDWPGSRISGVASAQTADEWT